MLSQKRKISRSSTTPYLRDQSDPATQGLTTLRQMPRVGMAVASPSTLNTLLQTLLSCTAFAIASAAVNQQSEDPGPRVVGAKLLAVKLIKRERPENVEVEKVYGNFARQQHPSSPDRHERVPCFALSGRSIPAAPAFCVCPLRMSACAGSNRARHAPRGRREPQPAGPWAVRGVCGERGFH